MQNVLVAIAASSPLMNGQSERKDGQATAPGPDRPTQATRLGGWPERCALDQGPRRAHTHGTTLIGQSDVPPSEFHVIITRTGQETRRLAGSGGAAHDSARRASVEQ